MFLPVPVIPLPPLFGTDTQPAYSGDTYVNVGVTVTTPEPPKEHFIDSSDVAPQYVADWDSYVGQDHIKHEIDIYIQESFLSCEPLPHILLAASMPGVGKTTLARLIAQKAEAKITMLVPPFTADALYEAAMAMTDCDILFIDEIHQLADNGPSAAENLLHLLEEGVLYLNGSVIKLAEFTVIGATTDADKLPEAVLDRFPVQPYFQDYSSAELVRIVANFCKFYDITLLPDTMVALAGAARKTPRIARALVEAAKALQTATGRMVTGAEVLEFKQVDADGMTRLHKSYVTAIYKSGRQLDRDDEVVYRAGEATMATLLRQNANGVARIERFLIESGFLNMTGRGRQLTDLGVAAAERYVAQEATRA